MRWAIGAVKAEAPADRPGDSRESLAMALIAAGVVAADAFHPADYNLILLLDAGKPNPSIERQVFLSRVGDLQ